MTDASTSTNRHRVIGILGGMSWESSLEYYRIVNQEVHRRLGEQHLARVVLWSVDFEEIERCQAEDRWDDAGRILADAARGLERAGAECIVLATNTMHKLADAITTAVEVPFLHIAEATGRRIEARGLRRIGLLGTRYTMEQDFYRGKLERDFDFEVLVPPSDDRQLVHDVIYDELCHGRIVDASRDEYRRIVADLVAAGAEGVILGCTEIGLLISEDDVSPADGAKSGATTPLFDTTRIHAEAAVDFALSHP